MNKMSEVNKKKKFRYYNNGVETKRFYEDEEVPHGWTLGNLSLLNRTPWNKGLSAKTDDRVKRNVDNATKSRKESGCYTRVWNKGLTKETDCRIKGLSGKSNPMYGKHTVAWNKGLTKETDERVAKISESNKCKDAWNKGLNVKGHPQTEETRQKIRLTHQSPEFLKRRYETMIANGTLCVNRDSAAEIKFYGELVSKYGEADIIHPYFDKKRYPFQCDFYIISKDEFIELHSYWTRGGRPYDENDVACREQLAKWQEKAKTSDYYKNAIYTWTDLDVRKVKIAKENNLNFVAIYNYQA